MLQLWPASLERIQMRNIYGVRTIVKTGRCVSLSFFFNFFFNLWTLPVLFLSILRKWWLTVIVVKRKLCFLYHSRVFPSRLQPDISALTLLTSTWMTSCTLVETRNGWMAWKMHRKNCRIWENWTKCWLTDPGLSPRSISSNFWRQKRTAGPWQSWSTLLFCWHTTTPLLPSRLAAESARRSTAKAVTPSGHLPSATTACVISQMATTG